MLFKQTHQGDITPIGLSIRKKDRDYTAQIQIRVPILIWWRKGYDISWDEFWTGWWALHLFVSLDKGHGLMFGIRLALGWVWLGKTVETAL